MLNTIANSSSSTSDQKMSDPPPAHMHLFDNFIPGLHDGKFRLIAQHSVEVNGKDYHYYQDQPFIVKGPRFSLMADEFHAQFPGEGTTGDFSRYLPHIVLRKRALPWERWFDKGNKGKNSQNIPTGLERPWLALLVIPETDLKPYTEAIAFKKGGPPHNLMVQTTPAEIIGKDTIKRTHEKGTIDVQMPDLNDEGEASEDANSATPTPILTIDLPIGAFLKARPALTDLPYLAHVRVTENLNKPKTEMHVQGDYSALLANRFPQEGLNHVFLVSLEGWERAFDDANFGAKTSNTDWMRFVLMKYWSFNNNANAIHTFGEVVDNVNNYQGNQSDYLKKKMKATDNSPELAKQFQFNYQDQLASGFSAYNFGIPVLKIFDKANSKEGHPVFKDPVFKDPGLTTKTKTNTKKFLQDGYVPIEYRPHHKLTKISRMMAWYRGPFSPVKIAALQNPTKSERATKPNMPPFARADEAMIIDNKTGVPDISYSAAWQLGRSLGLGSGAMAQSIRTSLHDVSKPFDGLVDFMEDINFYRYELKLAGKLDPSSKYEKKLELENHVIDFIARLALLDNIPFQYLVPDERLLPQESLRFFHIDNNWIRALIDGVLSIGVEGTKDQRNMRKNRVILDQYISEAVYLYRLEELMASYNRLKKTETPDQALKDIEAQMAGIVDKTELEKFIKGTYKDTDKPSAKTDYLSHSVSKSGFFLRSELVQHWPGVEVIIRDKNKKILTPLRFEHISDTIVLCIVVGTINEVSFKEPPEGISFGVDDEGKIMLRHLKDSIGEPIKPNGTELKFPSGKNQNGKEKSIFDDKSLVSGNGRLVITTSDNKGLVDKLAAVPLLKQEISSTNKFGPAAFGLQLVRSPEEKDFYWEKGPTPKVKSNRN